MNPPTVYLPLITLAVWAQLSLSIYQELRAQRMAQAALHALEYYR